MEISYNRRFGLLFSIIFLFLAYYFNNKNEYLFILFTTILILFLTLSIFKPSLLNAPSNYWLKFGLILGKIISPIILGIIFFLILTPISIITRIFGRDELRLKKRNKKSFWVNKSIKISGDTFDNQF